MSQLTTKDVTALGDKSQAPDLKAIAPVINEASVTATYSGATYAPSQFVGTNADYLSIRDYTVADGVAFTNQDVTDRNRVALLGQTVVDQPLRHVRARSARRCSSTASTSMSSAC